MDGASGGGGSGRVDGKCTSCSSIARASGVIFPRTSLPNFFFHSSTFAIAAYPAPSKEYCALLSERYSIWRNPSIFRTMSSASSPK